MPEHFIYKLSPDAQRLFQSDPRKFDSLYGESFTDAVKQDILHLAEIAIPVFEVVHKSNWYDSWLEKYYWYSIAPEYQNEAYKMFQLYCDAHIIRDYARDYDSKKKKWFYIKTVLNAKDKEFFDLLRAVYFYNNYTNENKWHMPGIKPQYESDDVNHFECYDFVNWDYKNGQCVYTMRFPKTELSKLITSGSRKIANKVTDARIQHIKEFNEKIRAAQALIAQHGNDIVPGY